VLSAPDKEWLHQLVGDWQTVSDVSFSDLLLAVPNDDGRVAFAAHCRPATATTLFDEDVVGCESTPDFQKAAWATLPDGDVKVLAQGPADAVSQLVAWLHHGSRWARVDDVRLTELPPGSLTQSDFRPGN